MGRGKTQIYSYIRTSRAAVNGLAGMHPETQVQTLAGAGVELAHIVCGVGITSLAPAESWLEPLGPNPTEVEQENVVAVGNDGTGKHHVALGLGIPLHPCCRYPVPGWTSSGGEWSP